jgi:hypothetical protein
LKLQNIASKWVTAKIFIRNGLRGRVFASVSVQTLFELFLNCSEWRVVTTPLSEDLKGASLLGISYFWVTWGLDRFLVTFGGGNGDRRILKTSLGLKGAGGMGCAEGTGVLRCAQDDGKNRQRQRQKQKQGQKQIPFGDDNQRNNGDKNNDNGRNNNDNGRNKQRQGQKQIPFGDDNQRDNGNSRTIQRDNGSRNGKIPGSLDSLR